jgi:23S rRNA (uracil1939-C5)-methyltransferase
MKDESASPLQPGEAVEVLVEKGVYRGQGLARHQGQVVFVPRGLPGDRHRVRVVSASPGYVRAESEALLEGGAGRRPSPCPAFPQCGGCAYQELTYEAQLHLKEDVLRESLARAHVPWEGPIPLVGSPEEGWRTRASFHLQERDGRWLLGLYEDGTHRVVDLPRCLQLSPAMGRVARRLLEELSGRPAWARGVAGIDLAEAGDGSSLVVALETTLDPGEATALSPLARVDGAITGLGVHGGRGRARRFLSLAGEPFVETTAGGVQLRSHVQSFFQSNRFLVDPLVAAVGDLLGEGGDVLDLYAGVGLFALASAARAESVHALELSPTAVEDAEFNVRRAGRPRVRVSRAEVATALARLPSSGAERVILDPPRTGAGPSVVRALSARRPEVVVYVSCDPPTLGRDLRTFAEKGYLPDAVQAFDLFPDTFHLETVVRLRPR